MSALTELPAAEVPGITRIFRRVARDGERVVVSEGSERVAIVSERDLERLKKLDLELDDVRRRALKSLEAVQERSALNGNSEMTDEEINAEIAAARAELSHRQAMK